MRSKFNIIVRLQNKNVVLTFAILGFTAILKSPKILKSFSFSYTLPFPRIGGTNKYFFYLVALDGLYCSLLHVC